MGHLSPLQLLAGMVLVFFNWPAGKAGSACCGLRASRRQQLHCYAPARRHCQGGSKQVAKCTAPVSRGEWWWLLCLLPLRMSIYICVTSCIHCQCLVISPTVISVTEEWLLLLQSYHQWWQAVVLSDVFCVHPGQFHLCFYAWFVSVLSVAVGAVAKFDHFTNQGGLPDHMHIHHARLLLHACIPESRVGVCHFPSRVCGSECCSHYPNQVCTACNLQCIAYSH